MKFFKKLFSKDLAIDAYKAQLQRHSINLDIGGKRPSDDIKESWFGNVKVSEENETWPIYNDQPMKPLCQINLTQLEFKPEILEGIEFITIFISNEHEMPMDDSNGEGWLLRSYTDIKRLRKLESPKLDTNIKEFQMFPNSVECYCVIFGWIWIVGSTANSNLMLRRILKVATNVELLVCGEK